MLRLCSAELLSNTWAYHRPAEHEFMLDGKKVKRIVLGDWRDKACYLRVDAEGYELIYCIHINEGC